MSAQFSYDDIYEFAKSEYDAEVMNKWLYNEKANFAYLKFVRAIEKHLKIEPQI